MKLFPQQEHPARPARRRVTGHVPGVRRRRTVLAVAAPVLAAITVLVAAPAQAQAVPRQAACVRHDTTVTLTPDAHATRYRVAGWLCGERSAKTVQLLLSGFSYDHHYWTGIDHQTSYVDAAVAAGDAVYNIDRVGVGQSDRAPATQLDVTSEAYVADQLVHALRNGTLGRYDHVVGVGHSYGSAIWMVAAAHGIDTDAVILTGLLHQANAPAFTAVVDSLHPAGDDPKFAGTAVPDGYLTTTPGTRGPDFYYAPGANRSTIAWDERTKVTGTTAELNSVTPALDPAVTGAVHQPVLLIVGDHDALVCNAATGLPCGTGSDLCQRERPYYPTGTPLYAATIPGSGHSINLHRTAPLEFLAANQWAARTVAGTSHGSIATSCPPGAAPSPTS